MCPGFITGTPSSSLNSCKGNAKIRHPWSSDRIPRPARSWPRFSGMLKGFCWLIICCVKPMITDNCNTSLIRKLHNEIEETWRKMLTKRVQCVCPQGLYCTSCCSCLSFGTTLPPSLRLRPGPKWLLYMLKLEVSPACSPLWRWWAYRGY